MSVEYNSILISTINPVRGADALPGGAPTVEEMEAWLTLLARIHAEAGVGALLFERVEREIAEAMARGATQDRMRARLSSGETLPSTDAPTRRAAV